MRTEVTKIYLAPLRAPSENNEPHEYRFLIMLNIIPAKLIIAFRIFIPPSLSIQPSAFHAHDDT
jgi:hypothetical protein